MLIHECNTHFANMPHSADAMRSSMAYFTCGSIAMSTLAEAPSLKPVQAKTRQIGLYMGKLTKHSGKGQSPRDAAKGEIDMLDAIRCPYIPTKFPLQSQAGNLSSLIQDFHIYNIIIPYIYDIAVAHVPCPRPVITPVPCPKKSSFVPPSERRKTPSPILITGWTDRAHDIIVRLPPLRWW